MEQTSLNKAANLAVLHVAIRSNPQQHCGWQTPAICSHVSHCKTEKHLAASGRDATSRLVTGALVSKSLPLGWESVFLSSICLHVVIAQSPCPSMFLASLYTAVNSHRSLPITLLPWRSVSVLQRCELALGCWISRQTLVNPFCFATFRTKGAGFPPNSVARADGNVRGPTAACRCGWESFHRIDLPSQLSLQFLGAATGSGSEHLHAPSAQYKSASSSSRPCLPDTFFFTAFAFIPHHD